MKSLTKNRAYIVIAIVLILLTLLLPLSNFAKNNKNEKKLILLGNNNLAPIVYDDNGTAKGVAVDIVKAIGEKIGYEVKVLAANWEQAQTMVLNGEADGLLQINPSPERKESYDFSSPLLKSEFSLFVHSGNVTIKNIDDLKSKRVGIEAGGYPSSLLVNKPIDQKTIYDWETSFKELSSGDLDAIIVDRWIGEYELAKNRVKDITVLEKPIEMQYSRIAVRKGDSETLSLINDGIKQISEDGTLDKIMKQWQGKRVLYLTEDYLHLFYLRTISIFLLLIAVIAMLFVRKYRKLSQKLEANMKERTEELNLTNERLKEANLKLERISMIDGLTSIENRRALDIAYKKAWELSISEKTPLALVMIDIDHFKIYNDYYGHLSGDQALIKIAEVIKGVISGADDIAARYGGEEFVVLLRNTTLEYATIIAEKARKKVEQLGIKNESNKALLTISLGVASIIPTVNTLELYYKSRHEKGKRVK